LKFPPPLISIQQSTLKQHYFFRWAGLSTSTIGKLRSTGTLSPYQHQESLV